MTSAEILTIAVYFGSFIIGIVTLRILIVTLKETVDLNRKQLELIQVSINQAAREIRPEFELKKVYPVLIQSNYILKITCLKYVANQVGLTANYDASRDGYGNLIYHNLFAKDDIIPPGEIVWSANFKDGEPGPTNGFFRLLYADDDGRKYEQRLFWTDGKITNGRPVLLSNIYDKSIDHP